MAENDYVQPPRMPNLLSFNIGGRNNTQFPFLGNWQLQAPQNPVAGGLSYGQQLAPGGLTTPGGIQNWDMNQAPNQPTLGGFSAQLSAPPAGPSSGDAGSILSRVQRKVVTPAKAPLTPQPQGALSPAEYAAAMKNGGTPPAAPAAGALPAVPANAPGYNEMLDAKNFENTLGGWKLGIAGLQTAGSIGLGIWQMLQAQEMQGIAKNTYKENYNSTAQAYNTRMRDQYIAARGDTEQTRAEMAARDIKPSTIK